MATTTYVALLRGVNVGGKNKVPMAALRAMASRLGYEDPVTLLQSGNLIFGAAAPVEPPPLEEAIKEELGLTITVVLRTAAELAAAAGSYPFPAADNGHRHLAFLREAPTAEAAAGLDHHAFLPDEFAVAGAHVHLHLPNGTGRGKLVPYLDRRLGVPMTVRNWNTVTKLQHTAAARS